MVQRTRGSHLYVLCRSVWNCDQNWIKWSKPFWGADQGIKVTSEMLKINNQECTAVMWPLTPGNQAIKSLRREQLSDQAHFVDQKPWSQSQTLLQATCKWLPLEGQNGIEKPCWSLLRLRIEGVFDLISIYFHICVCTSILRGKWIGKLCTWKLTSLIPRLVQEPGNEARNWPDNTVQRKIFADL